MICSMALFSDLGLTTSVLLKASDRSSMPQTPSLSSDSRLALATKRRKGTRT